MSIWILLGAIILYGAIRYPDRDKPTVEDVFPLTPPPLPPLDSSSEALRRASFRHSSRVRDGVVPPFSEDV